MSLADIARSLGLSVTTVSRALGGFDDVARATRARVLAEARRIDYQPNHMARRLRRGRSEAIGVVLPAAPGQFDDPFFLRFLAAIGPRLQAAELDLLISAARPGADEMRAYRHLVEGRRVDGILLARTRRHDERISYLLQNGLPFVAHGRSQEARPFAYVDVDGEAALRAATERLIGFGHRNIGLINAAPLYMFSHFRREGWRAALTRAGLPIRQLREAEPTEENGFLCMRELLREPDPPTAVLCATDRLAVGALHALADAGLRAGREVSVIGYDDLPLATYTDPPLTTIAQPIDSAAVRMVDMLLLLMAGADPAGLHEVLPARLIERASDGPLRVVDETPNHGGGTHHATTDGLRP